MRFEAYNSMGCSQQFMTLAQAEAWVSQQPFPKEWRIMYGGRL